MGKVQGEKPSFSIAKKARKSIDFSKLRGFVRGCLASNKFAKVVRIGEHFFEVDWGGLSASTYIVYLIVVCLCKRDKK